MSDAVTWLGHATALIDAGGARLLTDPLLRGRIAHLRRHGAAPAVPERLDAVLLSHLHRDHADGPSLRRLPEGVPVLVPRGAGATVRGLGRTDVRELAAGDSVAVAPGVVVHAVPAVHDGRRSPLARGTRPDALGYVVDAGPRIYFAGDTEVFAGMGDLGPLDAALLPVWGWGTSLGPGHMDPREAAEAAALLRPSLALPIHWATYLPAHLRRTGSLLTDPGRRFAAHAATLAPATRVEVVAPGATVALAR